jgi:SAM-dependent methyltransferase
MVQKKEWFENWFDSKYYPILYDNRDLVEAETFVDNLMKYLKLPSESVVADMACGEGRYSYQLAKFVNRVVGFDLSQARIQVAKERYESEHIRFYQHDMRAPMYVNYFDAIFNFFTSFGYFSTYRDHKNAAQSLANGLKNNGILVIDYLNADNVIARLKQVETVVKQNITFNIKRYVAEGKIVKEISILDPAETINLNFAERVSAVHLEDFDKLFSSVGMKLLHVFGDYNLSEYDKTKSPRLIMIFTK